MITVTGIDEGALSGSERNAYLLLTNMTDADFALVKSELGLGQPGVLGPQTLAGFEGLCARHGVTLDSIGTWKEAHDLSGGVSIGPTTAAAVAAAIEAGQDCDGSGVRDINDAGLTLIKSFEGLHVTAYNDGRGVCTIGWGHTGPDVHYGLTITVDRATALLESDLLQARREVCKFVTRPLNNNQFAALVSIVFNAGDGCLIGTHLGAYLNAGDWASAANAFLSWDHVNGVVWDGLRSRREAERALFLET